MYVMDSKNSYLMLQKPQNEMWRESLWFERSLRVEFQDLGSVLFGPGNGHMSSQMLSLVFHKNDGCDSICLKGMF